jgi:CubicO group peptidase (beta-lactamase class C family)
MKKSLLLLFFILAIRLAFGQAYFPSSANWEKKSPAESGFDTAKLNQAIRFAIASVSKGPRNMEQGQKQSFGREPFGEAIGPFADRGEPTGLIIYRGYIIAEWGEPSRVDMTHSVTKSFLSTVVGLAVDQGLIKDVNDTVANYVNEIRWRGPTAHSSLEIGITPFSSEHNKKITWETLLRQTSDWEGSLWGKPDWADRPDRDSTKWHNRQRNEPGRVFEYNDVRVNALALAATKVWRRSLPQVLAEKIMQPIGASSSWKWEGYNNSFILIDGSAIQSVSGGGHWGGGMFINAYDMGRFGLLTLHEGNWNGRQLISKKWIGQARTPTKANPGYGYMNFFLNNDKKYLPAAPATVFVHVGNGTNIIYVDPEHDLVMVVRWIENNAIKDMVRQVLDAMK